MEREKRKSWLFRKKFRLIFLIIILIDIFIVPYILGAEFAGRALAWILLCYALEEFLWKDKKSKP